MTATQSLRIIDFFKHHNTLNQNNVNEFLVIVDEVVKEEVKVIKETTATKIEVEFCNKDIQLLQQETRGEFNLLRQEMKTMNAEFKAEIRADLNKHLVWIFGALITVATLAIGIAKMIF
jgi:hypothetical protein